jgi:hypothetical protein
MEAHKVHWRGVDELFVIFFLPFVRPFFDSENKQSWCYLERVFDTFVSTIVGKIMLYIKWVNQGLWEQTFHFIH